MSSEPKTLLECFTGLRAPGTAGRAPIGAWGLAAAMLLNGREPLGLPRYLGNNCVALANMLTLASGDEAERIASEVRELAPHWRNKFASAYLEDWRLHRKERPSSESAMAPTLLAGLRAISSGMDLGKLALACLPAGESLDWLPEPARCFAEAAALGERAPDPATPPTALGRSL